MREALELMSAGKIIGCNGYSYRGPQRQLLILQLNLPQIKGGKKLIYTNISLPLVALDQMKELATTDPLFAGLNKILENSEYIWNMEAEKYLLANANQI